MCNLHDSTSATLPLYRNNLNFIFIVIIMVMVMTLTRLLILKILMMIVSKVMMIMLMIMMLIMIMDMINDSDTNKKNHINDDNNIFILILKMKIMTWLSFEAPKSQSPPSVYQPGKYPAQTVYLHCRCQGVWAMESPRFLDDATLHPGSINWQYSNSGSSADQRTRIKESELSACVHYYLALYIGYM